ncbi:MAG: NUDIX domain-containing protein [candidate division SR1 bacterium]|nr:NUDIX domain-containing protein [candidate division SR1 bacterium]
MGEIIQSAGGVVYYIAPDGEPRYLLIKRHALSGKIERVAPKGKIQGNEDIQKTALREVSEETGIPLNQMRLKEKVGTTQLRNTEKIKGQMDKDVTYFLIQYFGDPDVVNIDTVEGYIGIYKWATLSDVLGLIYYQDIRELIRKAHTMIKEGKKISDIKQNFMDKLE